MEHRHWAITIVFMGIRIRSCVKYIRDESFFFLNKLISYTVDLDTRKLFLMPTVNLTLIMHLLRGTDVAMFSERNYIFCSGTTLTTD